MLDADGHPFAKLSPLAKSRLLAAHASRARVLFAAVSPMFAGLVWLLREAPKASYVAAFAWLAFGVLLLRGHMQLQRALANAGVRS
jgi:hypothetical protein